MRKNIKRIEDVPANAKFLDWEDVPFVNIPGFGCFDASGGDLEPCLPFVEYELRWKASVISHEKWLDLVKKSIDS